MLDGMQQIAPRGRVLHSRYIGHTALRHQAPTAFASAGPYVNDVVSAADGVLVVLHHDQCVAFVAQLVQGVEQYLVVPRMQANRGLVEHIAHALQIAAQLGGQPNALRLAARQSGRTAI